MSNQRTKQLTHGAMMTAVFTVLIAASVYVPILSVISVFFLALPIAWYSATYGGKASGLLTVSCLILAFVVGGLLALPLAMVYIPFGLAVGLSIRHRKSKLFLFMAASLVILFSVIIQYVASIYLFNINILQEFMMVVRDSYEQAGSLMERFAEQPEDYGEVVAELVFTIETLLPTLLVLSTFALVSLLLMINLPVLKRLGPDVPKFPPFRNLKLPKSVLWYYLVVLLTPFLFTLQQGTMPYMVFLNASVLLQVLLFLQGISFYHFYVHQQGWPKWVTVLVTILAFPLQGFTGIVGIIDLGFNIRGLIEQANKSKGK